LEIEEGSDNDLFTPQEIADQVSSKGEDILL